ncbi:L-cystine transporter-like protein [Macrophomina phaseolina]|uniref:L-cystine transporter-like protein n=1 Tax=Macrophomina phaseolina TaxID=35725 RepID=A0ABQ8GDE4_9PEZI|nr:L-cystine transporter-like protein [Macrophomina phaseolina]
MASPEIIYLARALSRVLGWAYFLCWSASFYPQPLMNWRRKSTLGFGIDFPTLNILGFLAYTVSTAAMLWSPTIRSQYAARYPVAPEPTVRFNDFAFALHAVILCIIIYSQFWLKAWGFKVGADQKVSSIALGIFWGNILGVIIIVLTVWAESSDGGYDPSGWAWIDVIYAVGYVKLVVTVVKYVPQVWLNFKRKSTVGFSIGGMLLDFSGGILSNLQLIIDSSLEADWSGITGNPVKFGLANVSIIFDVIFIIQHYILYRHVREIDETDEENAGERRALLGGAS